MTPIERVSARSKALAILGLRGNPTKSEVRKIFRKLAFEKHPDQGNSTDEHTLDMCHDILDEMEAFATHHLATRLYRKGRMLTYYVPTPAGSGLNQIALPTGDLVDSRRVSVMSYDVWSGDICGNVYDVPAQQCAKLFPGARSVQIRFGDPVHH